MSFMSPDQKALEDAIFATVSCAFCATWVKTVESRRTRFDVTCAKGHVFSLTAPQIRAARPSRFAR